MRSVCDCRLYDGSFDEYDDVSVSNSQYDQDEELWFNDEEDFDEEGSGPVLGPGGLGEPTKASCTSVSTTSPQAAAAATAALPCQEKVEAPSIVKVLFTLASTMDFPASRADELKPT